MAPLKSSLARTVGKFLGAYKNTDLSLRGHVQSNRFVPPPFEASGGNIDAAPGGNNYIYHVFTSSGTLTVPTTHTLDVLLVAGGGSGSAHNPSNGAGGGGAGGIVHHSQLSVSGPLTITIGDGGVHPNTIDNVGDDGDDSTIVYPGGPWTLTARGGGGGGYFGTAGRLGGSGGGGGGYGEGYSYAVGVSTQSVQNPSFIPQTGFNQYGNNGGVPQGANPGNAGGGGGAGGAGTSDPDPPSPNGSNGGDGQPFTGFAGNIPAFGPLPSAWKTATGPTGLYGGGGAGENPYNAPMTGYPAPDAGPQALGGPGGGGSGQSADGVANTGGGGAGMDSGPYAGDGGKGICIIRYQP